MAIYPTFRVAGVPMDDPSGRWELVEGTRVLPSFPGRKVVRWDLPGMVGSQSAAYAPGEAITFPIRLRINAVGEYAGVIVNGGTDKRTIAIRNNLDLLFATTGLARQGYEGLVEVRWYSSATDYRRAAARVISASEPEYAAYSDHAYITLLYEIPAGAWGAPNMDVTRAKLTKTGVGVRVKVPAGTAPSLENMIVMRAPGGINSKYGQRAGVRNSAGVGFSLGLRDKPVVVPANTWIMVNTLHWKYGFTDNSHNGTNWGISKPNTALVEPFGRPTGSALAILPSAQTGVGEVFVHTPSVNTEVIIRSRKMWY